MEIVKKNIPMKDVTKVMKEVGYNKASMKSNSGSKEAQLAEANERKPKTMADAVNRAVAAVVPPDEAPIKVPIKIEPKGSKSNVVEKLREKHKEPVKEDVPKGPKTVTIDMTTLRTKVTFVGRGWKPLDIKIANNELIKAFRIKIRDEYRKGIK